MPVSKKAGTEVVQFGIGAKALFGNQKNFSATMSIGVWQTAGLKPHPRAIVQPQ
ncbi:hypothetical protein [Bosea sp. 685]|uniref:hypothetical protein n=1 Tax=Bosea sp. 685 TaxID=3080057 RepID=UPI00289306DC|nr:hypothetical protein [Bosea sp. 685]WNJ88519.1 hypothetical protein RMR04_19125 [Bosea sp. 685]